MKPTVAILIVEQFAPNIMTEKELKRLSGFADIRKPDFKSCDSNKMMDLISDADACITSWDTPALTSDILDSAKKLKMVFHAAGSVKPVVSEAFWERKLRISSGAPAIGIGVAEHALGLILSATKRCYWFNEMIHAGGWRTPEEVKRIRELYGAVIGVVGAGYVGRHMIKLLQCFDVDILLYDPFVSDEEAEKLGARKVISLDDMMSQVDVLTLHAPDLPETRHMINADNLKLMKDGSLIVNTARGSLIDESALYEELKTNRMAACLDVTDPEPPAVDNKLRTLSNIVLTPHIAGTAANNMARIGKYAVDEIDRFFTGQPLKYEVVKEALLRIA